jgi:hypothetical protein
MRQSSLGRLLLLACWLGILFVIRAHAADINGGWVKGVSDLSQRYSICSRGLAKENNKIAVYDSEAVVIYGNEIIGASATCRIKARKDEGQFVRLMIACPAQIADNELILRIDGPNRLTRIFLGMPEMNTDYFRCPKETMP